MPLPTPKKGESLADFMSKFMGNSTAVKDYTDNKQRYAVGASLFREAKKKQRRKNLASNRSLLTPDEGETFTDFMGRFVSDENMIGLFPDSADRAEIASEIFDNNEENLESQSQSDGESGSDSTDIEPAIGKSTSEDEDEEEDEDEAEDKEDEEEMAYPTGGSTPAGTIPTAVIQGQGKKKYNYEEGNNMTLKGVSVLTTGMAKGHQLEIDGTTLEQVKNCAEQFKGGVKVNENHGAGIADIIGKLTNFRIDESGSKLLADLTFLKSRQDRAKYYMDLASEIPDAFGISISFSGESELNGSNFDLARCSELYSADLVQHPASNPTGLFSADSGRIVVDKVNLSNMETTTDTTEKKVTPSYNMEDFGKYMEDFASRLSALEAKMNPTPTEEPKAEMEATSPVVEEKTEKKEKAEMSAVEAGKVELSGVLNEIRTELSKMVSAPISHSAPAVNEKKPETFSELVNFEMKANNISKGEALRLCVGKYTEQYRKELSAGGFSKSF
jgi:hypothetical protein